MSGQGHPDRAMPYMTASDRPPYNVPTMRQVAATKANGLTVVSTFSGCGGSSLGYRMAGYTVLGANEFVEAAADVYRLNASPATVLWPEDVRKLSGSKLLDDIGLGVGDLDVLDGSPPCASFSMAGARSRHWGEVTSYSDTKQRTDDLFFEYARLLDEMQPRAFVAENVRGLVIGVAKGYFKQIYKRLESCGYKVTAAVLDASWLGVPQARQRLVFVGMRNDLGTTPTMPKPFPYRYSLADALAGLEAEGRGNGSEMTDPETQKDIDFTRFAIGPEWRKLQRGEYSKRYFQLSRPRWDRPFGTVVAMGGNICIASGTHPDYSRKLNLRELRRVCSFPGDFALTGTYEQRWERLGRSVPPLMMKAIADNLAEQLRGLR